MRDAVLFGADMVWDDSMSKMADDVLVFLRSNPTMSHDQVVDAMLQANSCDEMMLRKVWKRMLTFPHIFEVANAQQQLRLYDLHGKRVSNKEAQHVDLPKLLNYHG